MKQMPLNKKYSCAAQSVRRATRYVMAFMQPRLNEHDFREFRDTWNSNMLSVRGAENVGERYDVVYRNWIWLARYTYSSVRARLGEQGIRQFERAEIEAMTRSTNKATLLALGLLKTIAPGMSFKLVATQLAYEMQWTTPLVVDALSGNKLVVQVPECKIRGFEGTEDLCSVGCQNTYRAWFAEQFKLDLETSLQGRGCTKTLTVLR